MKTSNSSRQRNGDSIASQSERIKQTVANDRSPPDKDLKSLHVSLLTADGSIYMKRDSKKLC